jgi:succinate-semialdehyde dehydrogenase/glutarate-semialdehyde dehydrogenase
MAMESTNPTTDEIIATYEEMSQDEVDQILELSQEVFLEWRTKPVAERIEPLRRAAAVLRERTEDLARLMTLEMGKPITQARSEVEKCAWVCDYYADSGPSFLEPQVIETDARRSYVAFEPLGTVLAIMPWNFPLWQVFRFIAPGLTAGNAGVLKHASNVQGCAAAIEETLSVAGYPQGLFRNLIVGSRAMEPVIGHPAIKAVTLTGSTPAGQAIARQAGSLLKKTVLELGGSYPYVVLEDADLDAAVAACVTGRMINNGQSCIAAKRFIVPRSIVTDFEERLVAGMRAQTMGDPLDEATTLGPMARADLRDELHEQVTRSVEAGARCLLGGEIPEGPGAFYPATVLSNVGAGMPAYAEELFGPVAAILPVDSEQEALRVANDSEFGLGAAVFTRDLARGEEIAARHLEAGSCFVNAFVRSDPRLPFGGIKASGYGRELGSFGIHEFVNIKTVYIA